MMLKYLLLIIPFAGFSQEAVRVEYEAQQEFINNSDENYKSDLFKNSANESYKYELVVNNTQSNYKEIIRINNSQNKTITIRLPEISENIYKNFTTKELFKEPWENKKTLIKDTIQSFPWELKDEENTIAGYKVKRATYTNNNQTVEAWYAPDLPFKDGPSRFNGLPGLILKVKFSATFPVKSIESYAIISAINVQPYSGKIDLPKNAKIVTKEASEGEKKKQFDKQKEIRSQGVERD